MKTWMIGAVSAAVIGLSACDDMTPQQQAVVGAGAGAATGLLLADAFGANDNWKVVAALGGAAAGTMVAQNNARGTCAYARGDGTYYEAACP